MECKKALVEAGGDMEQALTLLGARATATAGKKADRTLGAGAVAAYIHSTGQVGAIVSLACETDFVSKNEEFVALAKDIAMQVSAMDPADNKALLAQEFIKDPSKKISALLSAATQKFGERIEIAGFSRLSVK